MTADLHADRSNIVTFPRTGVRFGVFRNGGHLLADWDTREEAERFIYPHSGRYVAEIVDGKEIGK